MLERMAGAKQTCDELKSFYSGESNDTRHQAQS